MRKKYSTPNLIKAVSLSAAMATLLSSVSPVFAANFAFVGGNNNSTSGPSVSYAHGSHGSVVLAGDDDFCGADSVIGRGGKQQQGISDNRRITAQEQYERFIGEKVFSGRQPYGTTTEKVTWTSNGTLSDPTKGYMGTNTFGVGNAMPEAYGVYSFATGCGSAATGNYSTVFGAGATAKAGGAQAFGVSALASGIASVAMGVGSEASGKSTVAIGGLATASGSNSIALGTKVEAKQNYSIAIGTDAKALGSGSIAIGGRRSDRTEGVDPNRIVTAKAENSIAIGTQAYAETEDSVAIGVNSQVLSKDGVAVGGGSISDRNKGVSGYDPVTGVGTTKTDMAWKSTTGAFSVGEVGGRGNGTLTRQITGVAAGSEDTDAVNVAQLKAMRDVIAGGGGWKLSANDTNPTDVNSGNTVDFSVNNSEEGKDNLTIVKNTEDTKHKIQFTLSDTLTLTKVTTGQSSMSDDGFIIQNGPMMGIDGIDAGDKKITSVADAEDDNDAVNYKQLQDVKTLAEKGWKLSVDGNNATDVKAGSTVDLVAGESENGSKNIKIVKSDDNKVTFALNDNLKLTSVTTGNSIMSDDGFKFVNGNGPSITANGINAGDKKITGVAKAEDDTDAVNYKQLKEVQDGFKTSWQLSVNGEDATHIGPNGAVNLQSAGSESNPNIKITKNIDNTVEFGLADNINVMSVTAGESIMSAVGFWFEGGNGPSITVNGIHAGDKTIKGVAAGENDTDAVNYKQLQDFTAGIKTGWKLSVDGDNATDVGAGSTVKFVAVKQKEDDNNESENTNIKITRGDNNEVKFDLSEYIKVGRVETGDSRMSNAGFMIKDGPRMTKGGIHAANTKITGVAAGEEDTDAVNYKQLQDFTAGMVTGWKLSVDGNNATDVKAGSTVDLVAGASEGGSKNIKIVKDNNKVTFSLNDNLKLTSVTTGNSIISDDGFKFVNGNGPSITENGINAGDKKITKVAKAEDDTDAVNFSQLKEIKDQIAGNNLVKWNEGQKLITIGAEKDGTKIDIAGNEGDRIIAGVKDAVNGNEAVNKKQLDESIEKISKDALLWDEDEQAFVARREKEGSKIDYRITHILDGDVNEESTDAINGSQLYSTGSRIAKHFGGNASFENGVFTGPKYELTTINDDDTITIEEYTDVGKALDVINKNVFAVDHRITVGFLDIADYFGGGAKYEKGKWTAPTFKVSQRDANGNIVEKEHHNVADALGGVNTSITDIYNQINNVTENSLVKWHEDQKLITIGKEKGGTKIDITGTEGGRIIAGVKDGEISESSTEAVNGSQINKISADIAQFFGGNAKFINGAFVKPRYNLTTIEADGSVKQKEYNDVGSALDGLDKNVRIVNANLISGFNDVAKYFGGGAGYDENGEWHAPTFKVYHIGDNGTVSKKPYDNVADAFEGVNNTFTNIHNQISDITKNSLVKQENESALITIGKDTGGTEISIANKNNQERTLSGIKDGRLSENSNDAINGSQINKISADIAKFFGGGAKFINGAFEGLKYTLSAIVDGKVGQANFYDVGSALKGLDNNVQDVNKRLTNVSNEFNQKIEDFSKDALLWDDGEEAFVARHEKDGQKTKSKLKYLLDGEIAKNSTDAITGNQLYSMSNQLANYFGGGAKYENGKWTDPTFKIVQVNADGTTVEKEHHNVADAFGDINNGMSNINNRIDDVINKVDTDALKWNDKEKAYDAGRNGKPNKIINVADGKIVEGSKDAVNGGQLWKTNERVTGVEKDVKHLTNRVDNISTTVTDIGETVFNIENKVNDIAEDAVRYDRDENGKKTNKITLAGGDASEPVLIDNVADGKIEKGSKEAVNGGQLHDYTKEQMKIILDQSKHYTDQRVNNIVVDAIDDAVDRANQYTDMKFNVLNYSIENVKKEARQAAAIGLAVSNLRYNDTPGKLSVGFGTGLWRSQSAFAFGAGYTSENGKYRSNISATTSGGHWGVGAGFNMTLN
ncbi:Vomp family autotransporter [Bartonella sp. PS17NMGDW]|uniref:Vomp family autotransporter n=1 Tax=Bartonella sp. PS17NMGDW TaxID=3243573 RepID=UPI0035CF3681